jgi:hypothetical protein
MLYNHFTKHGAKNINSACILIVMYFVLPTTLLRFIPVIQLVNSAGILHLQGVNFWDNRMKQKHLEVLSLTFPWHLDNWLYRVEYFWEANSPSAGQDLESSLENVQDSVADPPTGIYQISFIGSCSNYLDLFSYYPPPSFCIFNIVPFI